MIYRFQERQLGYAAHLRWLFLFLVIALVGCTEGVPEFKSLLGSKYKNLNPPILEPIADMAVSEGVSTGVIDVNSNLGTDFDGDGNSITYSCFFDNAVDGAVDGSSSCIMLQNFSLDSSTGRFDWTPPYTAAASDWEFKIVGSDGLFKDEFIFTMVVADVNGPPQLDVVANLTVVEGEAVNPIDINDSVTGTDVDVDGESITYSCVYDTTVDGDVTASSSCSSLPTTASFSVSTGTLSWSDTSSSSGPYEIRITGSDGALEGSTIFVINVEPPDAVPNAYSFTDLVNLNLSLQYESDIVQITGINVATSISVTGGEYQVCDDADCSSVLLPYTTTSNPSGVSNGNYVRLRRSSSSSYITTESVSVSIGGVGDVWSLETMHDLVPDIFIFTAKTMVPRNFEVFSNIVQIKGITASADVSVSGGVSAQFRVCSDSSCIGEVMSFQSAAATEAISSGQYLQVKVTSSASYSDLKQVTVNVGSGSSTWDVTSLHAPPNIVGSVKDVSVGGSHVCALLSDGRIKCWGFGSNGRLGTGSAETAIGVNEYPDEAGAFVSVGGPAIKVASGTMSNCALRADGQVICWGGGGLGRLGYGNTFDVGDNEPANYFGAVSLGDLAVDVAVGASHACAVLRSGDVRCWGSAANGKLGHGITNVIGDNELPDSVQVVPLGAKATKVVAGESFTCALLIDGGVKCWGMGASGRLGNNDLTYYGDDEFAAASPNVTIDKVKSLSAFRDHTCALRADGNVYCWGLGSFGRLGYPSVSFVKDPGVQGSVDLGHPASQVVTGDQHSCALLSNGKVRCWGKNFKGELGLGHNNTIGDDELPSTAGVVNLGGVRAKKIAAGGAVTCALLVNGKLKCWGDNGNGQLGLAIHFNYMDQINNPLGFPEVSLGGFVRAIQLDSGFAHNCILLSNGSVDCWGYNQDGQASVPAGLNEAGSVEKIFLGESFSCALKADGSQECWGESGSNRTTPSGEFALTNSTIMADGGELHSCNLSYTGTVGCYGDNGFSQQAVPSPMTSSAGAISLGVGKAHTVGIYPDHSIAIWGSAVYGEETIPVGLGLPGAVSAVDSGDFYSCAIKLPYRDIQCWGKNWGFAQTSTPSWSTSIGARSISVKRGHVCGVKLDGSVNCWGETGSGQLSVSTESTSIGSTLDVKVGDGHSCSLLADGFVTCWGDNAQSQLSVPPELVPAG